MNLQDLILTGRSIQEYTWKVIRGETKRTARGNVRKYYIDHPGNKLVSWNWDVHVFLSRRFGTFSAYHRKFSSLPNKKYIKNPYGLFIQIQELDATYPDNKETWPTKKYAEDRKLYLRSAINEYIDLVVALLEDIKRKTQAKKTVYNFHNINEAVRIILSQKNITKDIKSKASGNLLAQAIVNKLWALCRREEIRYSQKLEDIDKIAELLQRKSQSLRLKNYFGKNYTKFMRANRIRNQSCHAYEKAPSTTDIKSLTELYSEVSGLV